MPLKVTGIQVADDSLDICWVISRVEPLAVWRKGTKWRLGFIDTLESNPRLRYLTNPLMAGVIVQADPQNRWLWEWLIGSEIGLTSFTSRKALLLEVERVLAVSPLPPAPSVE